MQKQMHRYIDDFKEDYQEIFHFYVHIFARVK